MASEAFSTRSEFDRQVARMFSNWESSVRDKGIAAEKKAELKRTYERVGNARFTAGVEAALHEHSTGFFPSIGEFEEYIPTFAGDRSVRTCEMCADSGWPGHVKVECQHPENCQYCHGATRFFAWRKCGHGREDFYEQH